MPTTPLLSPNPSPWRERAMTITTNDGGTEGDYIFSGKGHIEFWDLSSNLVINGQSYTLVKGLSKLHREFRHGGFFAFSRSYNASKDGTYTHALVPQGEVRFEGLGNTISNLSIQDTTDFDLVGMFAEQDGLSS